MSDLGITDEDRTKMRRWAREGTPRGGATKPAEDGAESDGSVSEGALPCGCGPGIRNIMDTVSVHDYECPTCGERFRRREVKG